VRQLLEREHNIAELLQNALQPSLPGKVPGLDMDAAYQPALQEASIGGDFFDVFSLEKGCFALVVADLAGKGLAAASQVAMVRHMLRALLYQAQTTLAEAVTRLNDMLAEHNLLTGFATLFVGAYDVNERTLTYASCGQEPGLILRKAAGQIEELPPTGPVLGGFPGANFEERCGAACVRGCARPVHGRPRPRQGPAAKTAGRPWCHLHLLEQRPKCVLCDQIKARMMEGVAALATATASAMMCAY
jgi:serine phosphatase RsbU (regulator of sigma subunit)